MILDGVGYLFLSQESFDPRYPTSPYRSGLYIFTPSGELIWAKEVPWSRNLLVQTYKNHSVLTYWSAPRNIEDGISWGSVTVLDSSYEEIHHICPQFDLAHPQDSDRDGCDAHLHEARFTDDGTMLITAYNRTPADLSALGGAQDGWVYDALALEVNPETSEVLWRWNVGDHVNMKMSRTSDGLKNSEYGNVEHPWDWFHMNTIQKFDGNYLICGRFTSQIYYVAPSGELLWTLDGENGGDFGPLPSDVWIAFAHTALLEASTDPSSQTLTMTIFNNVNAGDIVGTNASHGLLLELPLSPGSQPIRLRHRFQDPALPIYSTAQGSVQHSSAQHDRGLGRSYDSNESSYLVGYGFVPVVQEWIVDEMNPETPARLAWSIRYGNDYNERRYRVEKHAWRGTPAKPPEVVVHKVMPKLREKSKTTNVHRDDNAHGKRNEDVERGESKNDDRVNDDLNCNYTKVYVSWNGATDVEAWEVYAGPDERKLRYAGRVKKKGFETVFKLKEGAGCVSLGAVRDGMEIRRSDVVCGV